MATAVYYLCTYCRRERPGRWIRIRRPGSRLFTNATWACLACACQLEDPDAHT